MGSLINCFQNAQRLNVISKDEADALIKRYQDMIDDGISNADARDRMAKQIKAEADNRERAALLTHVAVDRLITTMKSYRDFKGRVDQAQAFVAMHENMGDNGSFVRDAEGAREAILRSAMSEMKDVMREFRRGAFLGDERRVWNPRVVARMENMVREIMGVDSGDAKAKAMATAWSTVSEKLRVRFNDAGGAIGKLQGGYIPQSHNPLALLDKGRAAWVNHMMEPGRLDRDRMVSQLTGEKLTDKELRNALALAWDRITTDGYYDADLSAAPQGAGALYTQHADHRFIHFASPEKWMEYSKAFGSRDVYAAMMGHIQIMARDIAHMEVLGPNPNRTREFLKNYLRAEAKRSKSNEAVIDEQRDRLLELGHRLNIMDPAYTSRIERVAEIHKELDAIRAKNGWAYSDPAHDVRRSEANANAIRDLQAELAQVEKELEPFLSGERAKTVENYAVAAQMRYIMDNMREAVTVKSGLDTSRAMSWVESRIRKGDAMWDIMRGGAVGDPKLAAQMQSVRNVLAAGSLGSAVISSLTDPAFGQDARLRMGQGMLTSNFARIAMINLREMITMGGREDAIAAGLGLDSAMRVLHRSASEVKGWDHKFWTGYVADRVLTTGLLLPWTQAGKHVFGLDLMRFVAKMSARDWKDLPDLTRKAFTKNGIGEPEWAMLRQVTPKDGIWLRPTDVIDLNRQLGERYLQMIMRETRHGIPEATVESSSVMNLGQAGTLGGELWRSMMQFKGFGIGVVMLHARRIAMELGAGNGRGEAAGYAATLFLTSTMLGMVAIALKDVKDGRDPRKWLDEKTWLDQFYVGEAILQAGGLGIFGDFIRASDNRLGGGLAGTMMGPLGGKVENVLGIVSPKQIGKALNGKEVTSEEELVRMFRSGLVPFSNHWAVAALYQRALMDRVQRLADPQAPAAFQRTITKRMKDYNQGYWYPPGSPSPTRAPDLSRIYSTR